MTQGPDAGIEPEIDRKLVALLTGQMGNAQKINKICHDLGSMISSQLPEMIDHETGLKLSFSFAGTSSGMKNDLIDDLDEFMVLSDAGLKGWCGDFTIACPSLIIIAMVESLLGGVGGVIDPQPRAASNIELKMSPMLFDRIAAALRQVVDMQGGPEVHLSRPVNAESRTKPEVDAPDVFATEIKIDATYGPVVAPFSIIVPQRTLLRTAVRNPKQKPGPAKGANEKLYNEWTEQISDQVRRSDVKLEARIRLQPLKLGTIARLQAGDVIPFFDGQDVTAQVNANGRDLYQCEFGRSGEQYTVRVRNTHGTEDDLIKHLMG